LRGPDTLGQVQATRGGGCQDGAVRVQLYGATLATAGEVPAEAVEEEPGLVWLHFPIQTALGEGQAAMRLQGNEAMLPLGARRGELEVRLERGAGPVAAAELDQARQASTASLAQAATAWEQGTFRLLDDQGGLVGEVVLREQAAPLVAVYDATWWTGGLVEADREDQGPDIVLTFPVEPALQGETGQLRVNVPAAVAVVPTDRLPTELDRSLRLVSGVVTPQERDAAMDRARQAADQAEAQAMVGLGRQLARRAHSPDGSCRSWTEVAPDLAPVLAGYDVDIVAEGPDCVVEVEPTTLQHRRRFRARIGPEGRRDEP